jgi:PQQ-like domain
MVLSTRKSPSCSAARCISVMVNGNRIAAALLACFVLVWSANGHAQTVEWSHYFYGKREGSTRPLCGSQNGAANLAKDTAGNVIAASGGALDGAVIQKINAATGAVIWSVNYAGSRNIADCVSAVAADSTGNVVVAGSSFTGVTGFEEKPFVAKLAAETGAIIWIEIDPPQDRLLPYRYRGMVVDASDNILVTGDYLGTRKYDGKTGAKIWSAADDINASAIAVDTAGDVYITDYPIRKLSGSNGAEIWRGTEPPYIATGKAIRLAPDGNMLVAVDLRDAVTGKISASLRKYSRETGRILWQNQFLPNDATGAAAIALWVDSAGYSYVTGYTYLDVDSRLADSAMSVAKYSPAGAELWSNQLRNPATPANVELNQGRAITIDAIGNVFVTGTIARGPDFAWATFKLDWATGTELWRDIYAKPGASQAHAGVAVTMSAANNPLVLGYTTGTSYGMTEVRSLGNASGTPSWSASVSTVETRGAAFRSASDHQGNLIVNGILDGTFGLSIIVPGGPRRELAPGRFRLAKYDAKTGAELWSKTDPDRDGFVALALDRSGNAIVGRTYLNQGLSIAKYSNETGAVMWQGVSVPTLYAGVSGLAVDPNGDVYAAGRSTSAPPASTPMNGRVAKFNGATGAEVWTTAYASTEDGANHVSRSISLMPDGHPVVTGQSDVYGTNAFSALHVTKYNKSNGAVLWRMMEAAGEPSRAYAFGSAVDSNGDLIAAMVVDTPGNFSAKFVRVLKLAGASGAVLWKADVPQSDAYTRNSSIALDRLQNPILGVSGRVTKLDNGSGAILWQSAPVSWGPSSLNDIAALESGDVIGYGDLDGGMGAILFDSTNGATRWRYVYAGGAQGTDTIQHVTASGPSIFMLGTATPPNRKPGWFLQKVLVNTQGTGGTCRTN